MKTLFTIPIPSSSRSEGTFTCTTPVPTTEEEDSTIYLLTFTSPPDNRLTPVFINTFLLALDIIEHRLPRGVVITTSGITKFYSNGIDLEVAQQNPHEYLERFLWRLFRRLVTYPMPTLSLINGHAFAGGLVLAMFHDYRIQNPTRGLLCMNELEFGMALLPPMVSVFRGKIPPQAFRALVLEAKRFAGQEALEAGIVDAVGSGVDEAIGFIRKRDLCGKAGTGVYGDMKEEMYRETLGLLDDHEGSNAWREGIEDRKNVMREEAEGKVVKWEREKGKAKL